jgi:hypothetical protein
MTWLHVPSVGSPSARVSGLSMKPSAEQLEIFASSAWWRGKPSPSRLWSRRLKGRGWLARLSGRISAPSMAARGVEAWIWSLPACPVSRTPSPASGKGTTTSELSGRTSSESWKSASPPPSSSRTRRTFCGTPSLFGPSWDDWASRPLRRCYRPPSRKELPTGERGSFSSLPTPSAESCGYNQGGGQGRVWPKRPGLEVLMTSLPTPTASDTNGPGRHGDGGLDLRTTVDGLPTPTARDWKSGEASEETHARNARPLNEVVTLLPPPTAADSASSGAAGYSTASGRHSGTTLTDAVIGAASAGRRGRLNPLLSAWMQGIPIEWINSERWGCPSASRKPRPLSELSRPARG